MSAVMHPRWAAEDMNPVRYALLAFDAVLCARVTSAAWRYLYRAFIRASFQGKALYGPVTW